MAKLHFYRKIGTVMTKFADGAGTIDPANPFVVMVTTGSVRPGITYEIRQGTSMAGTSCECITVSGAIATFKVSG